MRPEGFTRNCQALSIFAHRWLPSNAILCFKLPSLLFRAGREPEALRFVIVWLNAGKYVAAFFGYIRHRRKNEW